MANRRIVLGLALLAPVPAQWMGIAAFAKDEADPNGPDPLALEEIVVTANKREESIQEVPMSVTAFTSEFFKDAGVTNLAGSGTVHAQPENHSRHRLQLHLHPHPRHRLGRHQRRYRPQRRYVHRRCLSGPCRHEHRRPDRYRTCGDITRPAGHAVRQKHGGGRHQHHHHGALARGLESTVETTYNSDERAELRGMVNVPLGDRATPCA